MYTNTNMVKKLPIEIFLEDIFSIYTFYDSNDSPKFAKFALTYAPEETEARTVDDLKAQSIYLADAFKAGKDLNRIITRIEELLELAEDIGKIDSAQHALLLQELHAVTS